MFWFRLFCFLVLTGGRVDAQERAQPLAAVQSPGRAGFTLLPAAVTGVTFTNSLTGDRALTNAVAHNGSGVALGDVDGDGWVDIYFCNLEGPNQLYRNRGGWRFEEIPLGAAACADQLSTAATLADIDGDGDLDLLVNGIAAGTRLFVNNGRGQFSEVENSGFSRTASAMSMALADIDGDGDLDVYCAHYIDVMHLADPTTKFALARRGERWEVTRVNGESTQLPRWRDRFEALPGGRVRELPERDGLYRNDGGGRFTAIESEPGVFLDAEGKPMLPPRDWGLAVAFRDLNADGAPDLYVCNDNASPDRVWINSGRGTFRMLDPLKLRHTSRSSMGVDFADINRDGLDDFIVLDMLARDPARRMTQLARDYSERAVVESAAEIPRFNRNTLFLGRRDGTFAETALLAGVAATDWSWCPVFLDVDLDGYEDLLVSNGFAFDVMDQDSHDQIRLLRLTEAQRKRLRQFHPPWPTANAAFRNQGDGTFREASGEWSFDSHGISYGMALGDLDNDGDLDVVVNHLNAPAGLYRNDALAARVKVTLRGQSPNTRGIGARIVLQTASLTQSQVMHSGGRYLSSDEPARTFAAGSGPEERMQLEVVWTDGSRSLVTNARPGFHYEINQAGAVAPSNPATALTPPPLFRDVSSLLNHQHQETSRDEEMFQPLLPRSLNRRGPGIGWFDVDGDGWDDLLVGAGRGGKPALFRNREGAHFQKIEGSLSTNGHGAVAGWHDGSGSRRWLVARPNHGPPPFGESALLLWDAAGLDRSVELSAGRDNLSSISMADVDGDGDLDVFVGAGSRPGRFPEPASSSVWLNENGTLVHSEIWSGTFQALGVVNASCFTDLNGDGRPDLAVAMEWGSVRVFLNEGRRFHEVTPAWGIAGSTGWWTGIAAGDFDGDGHLDLVVGNRGLNTIHALRGNRPVRLAWGDANGDGVVELVEAQMVGDVWRPLWDRLKLAAVFPDLPRRFTTHRSFGEAALAEVLGDRAPAFAFLEANEYRSMVLLNRQERFEAVPLPPEAQWSPVFGVCVADFDADGREDLFLGQNQFGDVSELTREDSGRGLILLGNGDGTFTTLGNELSGLALEGEQRGAAVADFHRDGRADLVVTQYRAATRLYRNEHARRGFRVRLSGPPGNPAAIGASVRLVETGGRKGPVRYVQAGSGWASQDSTTPVLGATRPPAEIWIRWPDGREQTSRWTENAWETHLSSPDAVTQP